MKNVKRIALLITIVLVFSLTLSLTSFANADTKPIEDNDKVYACIPLEYEVSVFKNALSYSDESGNTITYSVGENKFAPEGITILTPDKVQVVFEHFYLYDGDIERINECSVKYTETKKEKVNGYSCYYLTGNYAYAEDELNSDFACYFNAYVFATKENIFVVAYEDFEGKTDNPSDLDVAVTGIVLNGKPINGDKPKHNASHNFSDSPAFEDAVLKAQEETISRVFEEENIVGIFAGVMVMIFIVPTAALIIIAIVLIRKYSKNKKALKRYEMTYGDIPTYNTFQQNYGGYYNQPFNQPYQPYQPPINPVYQNNPQPQQPFQQPETKDDSNNEGAGE